MSSLFLNTVLLGGDAGARLDAAQAAGFDAIELWQEDVAALGLPAPQLRQYLQALGLGLTDYQVLRDFDGAAGSQREERRRHALQMLDTAVALGAGVVQAPANTRADADRGRIVEDLRWLGGEAAARGLRIAYEPMAWSTHNATLPAAWDSVHAAGADNLDVVVDAFHVFARQRPLSDLDAIPAGRIANVQLSDLAQPIGDHDVSEVARHRRLLPGDGAFPLPALLRRLAEKGYRGPIGLEVFNDTLKALPPRQAAQRAMTALRACLANAARTG